MLLVSTTSATVSFGTSHDGSGPLTYRIMANGKLATTSHHTRGIVVPLRCGTRYTVGARAVDRAGNVSRLSPVAHLRTHACLDTTAPAVPAGLRLLTRTDSSLTLSWTAAVDPGHGRVKQYVIYRDGSVVAGSTTTTYRLSGLQPARSYTLQLRARDAAGNLSHAATMLATTARPPQASGQVRPFVLASDSDSVRDAQVHYRDLAQIYPTYFEIDQNGAIVGADQPTVTRWFQIRGVKVMPRFHTENSLYIEQLANDAGEQQRLVSEIMDTVETAGYDGINLDFEMSMPTTASGGYTVQQRRDHLRSGFTAFVQSLAAALHAAHKLLSVDVAANWCSHTDPMTKATVYCSSSTDPSATTRPRPYLYDYRALAQVSDELWLLSWGLHWSTSDPGPVAGTPWLAAVRDYFTDLFRNDPALMAKLTLGVQLYGFDWSSVVVRRDQVAMPGPMPAAPLCSSGSSVAARPTYAYAGSSKSGVLTITWLCNTRAAIPLEYDDVQATVATLDTVAVSDPVSNESTYSAPDPDTPGATRTGWFADAATVDAQASLAAAAGWHVGLWRLGHEDQTMWTAQVANTGAGR